MPGTITHAYIFKRHGKNLLGSIIPDYLPFLEEFSWEETHDLNKAIQFKRYLRKVDRSSLWLAKGMISHILLDRAAIKSRYLAGQRKDINRKLKGILNVSSEKLEEIGDLFLDLVLDGLVKKRNRYIPAMIESSIRKTNTGLIASHIANFFKKDYAKIERGLEHLKSINFNELTTIDGASKEYFRYYQRQRKKRLLIKMYGLYLNKILRKNKTEIELIAHDSKRYLLKIEKNKANFHNILRYFRKNNL